MPSPTISAPKTLLGSLADLLDPVDDVFDKLGFVPNPGPQSRFLAAFDEVNTDQLYGGAAGGSKSTSLIMGALRAGMRYPGLQAFWFRRTFPELDQSILRLLGRYSFAKELGCRYNASRHELRFPNSSTLTFAHAKNFQEATALQSAEIQLLLLDERTTIPPDVVDMLYTRVRSGVAGLPCLGIRSATNPGNIGHSRVKAEYVEATDHGAKTIIDKGKRRRSFIQAKLSDTPQLDAAYSDALAAIPDPALRKAMRDGDWDVFAGQVFSEWRYDRHVVKPFPVPQGWQRFGGIDYGHRHPSAVVWAAEDQDKRLWVYQELCETQLGEKGLAARIKKMSDDPNTLFAFDPSMMNQTGDALPVATILQREGIYLVKGNNDRISGWQRIHTYLAEAPACAHHRALGQETCPLIHVFDNCVDLIRTLPAVPYNTTGKLEDVDTDSDDHLSDALRYLVMDRGHPSKGLLDTGDDREPVITIPPEIAQGIVGDTSMAAAGVNRDPDDLADDNDRPNGKTAKSPFV